MSIVLTPKWKCEIQHQDTARTRWVRARDRMLALVLLPLAIEAWVEKKRECMVTSTSGSSWGDLDEVWVRLCCNRNEGKGDHPPNKFNSIARCFNSIKYSTFSFTRGS